MTIDDEDDPPEDDQSAVSAEASIPLAFKLKIAKEVYDNLSEAEKDNIDVRREEDQQKLYRTLPEIEEEGERITKLETHKRCCSFDWCVSNGPSNISRNLGTNPLSLNRCSVSSRTWKINQDASHN